MQVKLKPEDEARAGRVRAAVGARSVAELVRVALAILEAGVVAPAGPCGAMAEAARGVVRRGARGVVGVQAAVAEAVGEVEVARPPAACVSCGGDVEPLPVLHVGAGAEEPTAGAPAAVARGEGVGNG